MSHVSPGAPIRGGEVTGNRENRGRGLKPEIDEERRRFVAWLRKRPKGLSNAELLAKYAGDSEAPRDGGGCRDAPAVGRGPSRCYALRTGGDDMAVVDPRFTYADLQTTPDDGKRHEVLEGDMLVSPAPKPRHQRIVTRLVLFLGALQTSGVGEVYTAPIDVLVNEHTALEPDVLFVKASRLGIVTERYVDGPPDLVMEVLSESTRDVDLGRKLRTYARFGVPEYWAVDPDQNCVHVFRMVEGTYPPATILDHADVLEYLGVSTSLKDLFA